MRVFAVAVTCVLPLLLLCVRVHASVRVCILTQSLT